MGTFELNNSNNNRRNNNNDSTTFANQLNNFDEVEALANDNGVDRRRIKQECIITQKVYDQCRQQDCLTPNLLGPARAHCTTTIGDVTIQEGEIIVPPSDAAAVTIDNLRLKKILIVDKDPSPFKPGFWDVDLKYVFVYTLIFRDARGNVIDSIRANSIFNKKVTLFGSVGTDIVIGTDLFSDQNETLDADPFVLVEGKAVALAAELKYCPCKHDCCGGHNPMDLSPAVDPAQGAVEVLVTIGLFTIIKLFRIVQLTVESRGFCIPKECEELSPLNPCEFFDSLEFPLNIFAPPQIEDFTLADVSPENNRRRRKDCGCDK